MLNTVNELVLWLNENEIDITHWGEGNAKSVLHLWDEIASGEVTLSDNPPRRTVDVVQVVIRRERRVLLEVEQVMENGSRRFRNQPPSEKIKPGETCLAAAVRCLQEELGVRPEAVEFLAPMCGARTELRDSLSYPGLLTEYTFYLMEAMVSADLPEEAFWRSNKAVSAGDPVKQHLWVWRYDRSFVDAGSQLTR